MARPVILGNGSLTVGLNENGLVHDFYFPYVGLDNLTTARSKPHMIGLWVDGQFTWINDGDWEIQISFEDRALISKINLRCDKLQLELTMRDFVDCNHDVFARDIQITNNAKDNREVRIFFHQIFQISRDGRADTSMFVPGDNYILDYKGRCSLLAYAETDEDKPFDQYANGNAGIEGKEGTYRDAEDGELSMSAVEHGGVDSTIRCALDIKAGQTRQVRYIIAAADSQNKLSQLQGLFKGDGFRERMDATRQHWDDWFAVSDTKLSSLDLEHQAAVRQSLMVIKAHTDIHGGIIASCDSSIYNYGRDYYSYVWPRDGAFVIWPLIRLGYTAEPKRFFRFCQSIIHADGYMMHKYQPDRAIGSTWHPLIHGRSKELAIQEDETAIIIYMLDQYNKYTDDQDFVSELYDSLVKPAADFMSKFIDADTNLPHASYDLWEEKFLTNTYSTAITYKALLCAADMATTQGVSIDADKWRSAAEMLKKYAYTFFDDEENHYIKGFLLTDDGVNIDKTLDVSSLYAVWKFDYGDSEHTAMTLKAVEDTLLDASPSGGSPRYEDDAYFRSDPAYRGNPWFVTTLWLAQYYAANGEKEKAYRLISWTIENTLPSGVLSEQIHPVTSVAVGVTPLVWSHAELINAILDIQ